MMEYQKAKKILLLSLIFFISGLLFFYFRMSVGEDEPLNIPVKGENLKITKEPGKIVLKNMPDIDNFKEFIYKGEEFMKVDLLCRDKYATILIYPKNVDYRYDPLGSKYNTAFECVSNDSFTESISLKSANLENSLKYYLVRAHQSKNGGWYDPY